MCKIICNFSLFSFPIVYHDKFYKDVLEAGELAKLAYYNDVVVGAVCCRIGKSYFISKKKKIILIMYLYLYLKKIIQLVKKAKPAKESCTS